MTNILSDSLDITADHIELSHGTTLREPQKRSLHGLTGSKLILNDISLEDPARGLLFTCMSNVEFKNIKIDGGCECDIVENLACDKYDFEQENSRFPCGFLGPGLSCQELKDKLVNETFCKDYQISPQGIQENKVIMKFFEAI